MLQNYFKHLKMSRCFNVLEDDDIMMKTTIRPVPVVASCSELLQRALYKQYELANYCRNAPNVELQLRVWALVLEN